MAALIDRSVLFRLQGQTEEAAQRALVAEARRQLDRAVGESHPGGIEQTVDGVKGRAIEAVKAGGVIHFDFHYIREVVEAALKILGDYSPVKSGHYLESHAVYLDGVRVDDFDSIETAKRVLVSNTVDYARVVEIGRGKRVPWSKQGNVPKEGPYHAAVKAVARRFGNVVNARFTFVGADENTETGSTAGKNRFPAIIIERR